MRAKHTSLTLLPVGLAFVLAGLAHAKPVPPPPPPPPPPAAALPAPAPAVAQHVKAMKKTWRCKGSVFMPDGASMPSDGVLTMKLDLDKFWAHGTYVGKGKRPYKFETFRTVDATSGKWHQVMIDNLGGQEVGTSAGPAGPKLTWLTEARGPMGAHKGRHTEELVGKELKMWGETSMDGKSWIKAYEVACK